MASNSAHHGEQHQHHEDDEHLPTASELYNTWSIGGLQENDVEELQRSVDDESIRAVQRDARSSNLYVVVVRVPHAAITLTANNNIIAINE